MQKITPMLWFDKNAEDALNFYTSVFKDSKIGKVSRYPPGSPGEEGAVMVGELTLFGQNFLLLNAGPMFKFNESVSFVIGCETQEEVDYYWDKLIAGGGEESMCGWLKDRFGLSWQVTPTMMSEIMSNPATAPAAMQAMMTMKKLDIAKLKEAAGL